LAADLILSLVENFSQSNARFNALDKLIITVHSVRMPEGFDKRAIKSRGRPLSVVIHLKRVVEVTSSENCLAHAIIIAIAKVENGSDYKAYRQGRKIRPVVQELLDKTGLVLSESGGIPQLIKFQEHFRQYNITFIEAWHVKT